MARVLISSTKRSHCWSSVFFSVCYINEESLLKRRQVFNPCLCITYKALHNLPLVYAFLYSRRSNHTGHCCSNGSHIFLPQGLCTCSSPRYFYSSLPHGLPVSAQCNFAREAFIALYKVASSDSLYLLSLYFSKRITTLHSKCICLSPTKGLLAVQYQSR